MRVRLLMLAATLTLTAASCGWPMYRFGPARTGFTPDTSISKDAVQSSMVLNWTSFNGAGTQAVVQGVAHSSTYAFDAAGNINCSGTPKICTPLWTTPVEGGAGTAPAVVGGVKYVGAAGGNKLYAFDAAGNINCSGTPKVCAPLWTAAPGGGGVTSPVVANGVVYVGFFRPFLYAFDAAGNINCSGTPKVCDPLWRATTDDEVGDPAVAAGIVYVGSLHKLYAFDAAGKVNCSGTPKTCQPLWTAPTGGAQAGVPAVANGVVYVASGFDDRLYAFDAAGSTNCSGTPKTCAPLWTAATGTGPIITSPAVANGVVYIAEGPGGDSSAGQLYAFDAAGNINCGGSPKTCQPLWTASILDAPSAPAVANGVVYVGSFNCDFEGNCDAIFDAFDAAGAANCSGSPKTCHPLWEITGASGSPVISRGVVYLNDGRAFGLEKVSPTTSILAPSNGATLSGAATLIANASDNVKVSRVKFRLTGGNYYNALIGTATRSPWGWSFNWNTASVPNDTYTLNSVAYDPAGNQGRSPGISITVEN